MEYPGNLYVVAAPSGAGKSSLVKALMELDTRVLPSVSHTTRPPRGQEKHGREYFFSSEPEFDAMVAQDAFVEWAHVHGNRYGTSKATIHRHLRTLANREFVRQDPLTQRYEPGVKLFQLGERLRDRLRRKIKSFMEEGRNYTAQQRSSA